MARMLSYALGIGTIGACGVGVALAALDAAARWWMAG